MFPRWLARLPQSCEHGERGWPFLQKDKEEKEEKTEHPMGWGRYAPPASFHNDPTLAEGEKQSVAPLSSFFSQYYFPDFSDGLS